MKLILLTILALVSFKTEARELYLVESMICQGEWNANPPQYQPSYAKAAIRATSFWTVRKRDCKLVPSAAIQTEFAKEGKFVWPNNKIGGAIGEPLYVDGDTVTVPSGVNASAAFELRIVDSVVKHERNRIVRYQRLEGQNIIYGKYHYNLTCGATVVKYPSHIENSTVKCNR